jgi:hypothetical protein
MATLDTKRKTRSKSMRKSRDAGLNFKETNDLQEEYEQLLTSIQQDDLENFEEIIKSSDMKYFLIHNDLDYDLYKFSVKYGRYNFMK